jgi:hypothetical protein
MNDATLARFETRAFAVKTLAALVVTAAALSARPAAAKTLLVFDETYTAIKAEPGGAGAFHHSVKPLADQPVNWTSPVDYSKGTVFIHLEVMSKPSARPTFIDVCFDGDLSGYGCVSTLPYTDVGVHDTPSGTWWNRDKIGWTKKRTVFHLVIKDPAHDGTPGGSPEAEFVPSKLRIVLSIVPPGETYEPPAGTGAADAGGGGAMDAAVDAGAPADAAGGGSSGGASGSGGVTGSGGAAGEGGAGGSSASGGASGGGLGGGPGDDNPKGGSSGGSGGKSGSGGSPAKPGTGGSSSSSDGDSPSSGGCAVVDLGAQAPALPPLLLGLLALAALVVRRRLQARALRASDERR